MYLEMENLLKLIKNPLRIYLAWLLLIITCCIVIAPILSNSYSGGEQKLFTYIAYIVEIGVYGFFFISIFTSFYVIWLKKFWYVNIPIFIITGYLIIKVFL